MTKRRPIKRRRNNNTTFERLEPKNLLATVSLNAGVLDIVGTNAGDQITISRDQSARVVVSSNAGQQVFQANQVVESITVSGRAGNDRIENSTELPAVIVGGVGDDDIFGGSGNDQLFGGAGNDEIQGRDGDDLINGNDGDDFAFGQDGNDRVFGGDGDDELNGGSGDDVLNGNDGSDNVRGLGGNDRVFDTGTDADEDNVLFGDNGDDLIIVSGGRSSSIVGGFGNDRIIGGAGSDNIFGGNGIDSIDGNGGNDLLRGGQGNDTLRGGAGDDTLEGGNGSDRLFGDDGNDVLTSGSPFASGNFAGNQNRLEGGNGDDTYTIVNQQIVDDFIGRDNGSLNDTIVDHFGNNTVDFSLVGTPLRLGTGDSLVTYVETTTTTRIIRNLRLFGSADIVTRPTQTLIPANQPLPITLEQTVRPDITFTFSTGVFAVLFSQPGVGELRTSEPNDVPNAFIRDSFTGEVSPLAAPEITSLPNGDILFEYFPPSHSDLGLTFFQGNIRILEFVIPEGLAFVDLPSGQRITNRAESHGAFFS